MKKEFIKLTGNDNVFVTSEVVDLAELTSTPVRKGMEKAIISNGKIVNVVSDSYGHLPNEEFFTKAETAIIDAGFKYDRRSTNRDDRQFAVDFILNDDRFVIKVKKGLDIIKPMLRFINSYDGMVKAGGSFGFHRLVCTNGMMVSEQHVGFRALHKGDAIEATIPKIEPLVQKFMENEFYELRRKFEVLAETPIKNLEEWVKGVADETGLFQFEMSAKNPEPSYNARIVLETIKKEAALLNDEPNAWLGYNAFNSVLHEKLKKGFDRQQVLDAKLFNTIINMN